MAPDASDARGISMAAVETVQRASGRGIWGWMFFDWAAQPFFTVVTTFIFGPYFVSRMASDAATGQAGWGYGIASAGFVIESASLQTVSLRRPISVIQWSLHSFCHSK